MDLFESCHSVNDLIGAGHEAAARDELIKLLAQVEDDEIEYSPLINRLIRDVGLFPYLDPDSSTWEDRYVYEAFKADVGEEQPVTLHREQSRLLTALVSGRSVAVSAPTSFGKSFVIDAFIAVTNPANVVILVPTIALADETRRRLQRKFGESYKIITAPDQSLEEKNILIFPQERAIGYVNALESIDILVVDEFYKASKSFDKERSPALIRAIVDLGEIAKQRYFLAPNISELDENPFTKGMEFFRMDFHTVYLEKSELYKQIGKDEQKKSQILLDVLFETSGKTLIYAGTYTNIKRVSNLLIDAFEPVDRNLLQQFQEWLAHNYDPNWELTRLVSRGVGFHNGQLHRSLSQIQIRLFEEEQGLNYLISTSSIIEGVNTSAENIVVWSNKNGRAKIDDFTYKNIIGRGGRMFRHFVGKIFILEEPPAETLTQLDLELPDELLGTIDSDKIDIEYTSEQLEAIHAYEQEMTKLLGQGNFDYFRHDDGFQNSNTQVILGAVRSIRSKPQSWNGLAYLNSDKPKSWERLLYMIMGLQKGAWEIEWSKYVEFVKVLSGNWRRSIPDMLDELSALDIGISEFFKLERNTTFKLASLLGDVSKIYNRMYPEKAVDLSPALSRFSHAFLPTVVYQLEEYGIPRMISRKIQDAAAIDLESITNIHAALKKFQKIGYTGLIDEVGEFDDFECYILRYFFDGIEKRQAVIAT